MSNWLSKNDRDPKTGQGLDKKSWGPKRAKKRCPRMKQIGRDN